MQTKTTLKIIGFSLALTALFLYLFYGFRLTLLNVSNIMFFVGLIFFGIGLFIVSNASELFTSFTFLTKRVFMSNKKAENYFKTLGEYLEHREAQGVNRKEKEVGKVLLFMGLGYLIISLGIGFLS